MPASGALTGGQVPAYSHELSRKAVITAGSLGIALPPLQYIIRHVI